MLSSQLQGKQFAHSNIPSFWCLCWNFFRRVCVEFSGVGGNENLNFSYNFPLEIFFGFCVFAARKFFEFFFSSRILRENLSEMQSNSLLGCFLTDFFLFWNLETVWLRIKLLIFVLGSFLRDDGNFWAFLNIFEFSSNFRVI